MERVQTEIGGRQLILETGELAKQANGAVRIQYGETVLLMTACYNEEPSKSFGFLPLTVDYREYYSAAGKIPGGFFKREGKPRDREIIIARMIDRPIRPLFPADFHHEVQVIGFLLSHDGENQPDAAAITGASTALVLSEMPFAGPIAAIRIGRAEGKFIINPTVTQLEGCDFDILVISNGTEINMIECEAREVSSQVVVEAMRLAIEELKPVIQMQKELASKAGKHKKAFEDEGVPAELESKVTQLVGGRIPEANEIADKQQRSQAQKDITKEVIEALAEEFPDSEQMIVTVIDRLIEEDVRKRVIAGKRLDGRAADEIRPISCEVGVLPRTHGSALFTRGQTQALAVVTLGTKSDEQRVDDVEGDAWKSFMLHYDFPPFSVGEVRFLRGPGRREIGHGALAEKSVRVMVPEDGDFPYTIRINSHILESNGSSSMASVCGASLALFEAGVPMRKACAGIAMGLVKETSGHIILTDILGDEDHYGDMDFKVAGTRDGITGIQLDLKLKGISVDILAQAIEKATTARMHILDVMDRAISAPRDEISQYAPRIQTLVIPHEKIGEVIGPGGKVIRKITEETETTIDIDDETSTVIIAGTNPDGVKTALEMVKEIVKEVEVGEIYEGTVVRITNFGAFVELFRGKDGLIHISNLAPHRVNKVEDVVKVGQKIKVRVKGIDDLGRIDLTTTLDPADDKPRGSRNSKSPNRKNDRRRHSRKHDSERPPRRH
ncbi:polyribonucleotide nucleotidyltransferase [candidate division WOR-3 bacterium]|uniref:Polyribonucleotide nucleotidyltransferase n=1 Tax=candidate division WOR-3 bacterium TaxID=2052148 RepID=A0A9D5K928_UNCW3|nr:polyribonucleotide nucleotidyltransferase [candidate division WOR-3 bacterium]MBD3364374.1 polyribonucleotide nucleotidyltransferase [candidate division WOR-3 bacterium]